MGARSGHGFERGLELLSELLRGHTAAIEYGRVPKPMQASHVVADSHVDTPVDERPLDELLALDLVPFARVSAAGLDGIMPAHVVYPAIDARPAGFSSVWIGDVLRERLGFEGLVFSDDLEMAGAQAAGDIVARADAAVAAGCDMVLACNDFGAMEDLLSRWQPPANPRLPARTAAMQGRAVA